MYQSQRRTARRIPFRLAVTLMACTTLVGFGWSAVPHLTARATAQETPASAGSSAGTVTPTPTPPRPLPLQMAHIGSARQLIVATGAKIGSKNGTLQFFNYEHGAWVCKMTVSARFGKRGLMDGTRRREGNKTTPTGLWKMPNFVFGYRRHVPSGAKMRYRRITRKSWWSSRHGRTYNTWVKARRWRGEHLYRVRPQYELAVSTGYNAKPNQSVYGRGTGIFLHVRGKGLTSGCVAISQGSMIKIVKMLDPSKHPAFAIGTLEPGSPTSIWAY